ncbi:hypothetical protein VC83_01924 [Pseudogymnoascus destructans]|uniref:Uncharacterized protein n=2 Tax=Pseudogymnoascus destructans TaxID=655981 RepID=L8G1F0_PSED2|nr:uncharacterized protein VC83_01924 [Pseudogymnoascus destructans]ELR07080.1 hypothetical protein GMDG_08257 [Pseudogymnoascus destructans 20631-21]OAF61695.1 hypothetical protein VC83_01924 [Pseudogymnoascus destructans]
MSGSQESTETVGALKAQENRSVAGHTATMRECPLFRFLVWAFPNVLELHLAGWRSGRLPAPSRPPVSPSAPPLLCESGGFPSVPGPTPAVTPTSSATTPAAPVSPVVSPTSPVEETSEEEDVAPRRSSRKRKRAESPEEGSVAGGTSSSSSDGDSSSDEGGDPHRALLCVCCLRCAKYLAKSPEFSCVFPASSTKCTRCTRLKDKCVPFGQIPPAVAASVRDLLALQSDFGAAVGGVRIGLRARIVAAAAALPAEVRVAVSVAPSAAETSAALLRNSEETLVVLRQMQRSMAALAAGGRKGKGKKRG